MGRPAAPPVNKVLVIHTAFIGDIVLATPFLAALRRRLPDAEITLLTTPAGAKLLTPNEWGLRLMPYDKRGREKGFRGFWRKARALRALRPDLTFCLHRSFRSVWLARHSGARTYGFAQAAGARLLDHRVSRAGFAYEAEKNLALLRAWGGEGPDSPYPSLLASFADETVAQSLLAGTERFVALAPSSVWATKRWPAERFGALAARLFTERGIRCVIVGSDAPADLAAAAQVVATAGAAAPLNLSGKTSLGALKSVLSRAEVVVSNDSSPLHMAIAAGTPVVGVFGPTVRELGFFPLAPPGRSAVAEVPGLACRPCGLHGHHACPLGHFRCMLLLSEAKVYEETIKLLCP